MRGRLAATGFEAVGEAIIQLRRATRYRARYSSSRLETQDTADSGPKLMNSSTLSNLSVVTTYRQRILSQRKGALDERPRDLESASRKRESDSEIPYGRSDQQCFPFRRIPHRHCSTSSDQDVALRRSRPLGLGRSGARDCLGAAIAGSARHSQIRQV